MGRFSDCQPLMPPRRLKTWVKPWPFNTRAAEAPVLPEWQIHSALACLQKQTPKVQVMKPVPHLLQLSSMQKVRGQK